MFDNMLHLDVFDAAIDFEPAISKGGSPMPGVVASANEVEKSSVSSWSAMVLSPHLLPNIQAFFPQEVKDILPPNQASYYTKTVQTIVSQEVLVDCFGGGLGSSTSLSLLLEKVLHTRKTSPMLQLEALLGILRHVSPDHADLSGPAPKSSGSGMPQPRRWT